VRFASYLVKNSIVKKSKMICEQGNVIGRSGKVLVEVNNDFVKVGGIAKIIKETKIDLK
jgi:predicted PhzF superfamily epimerase YddE/YHI9